MTGNLLEGAVTVAADREIGVAMSAQSNAERAREAKDILGSTSGNRVETVARAAKRDSQARLDVGERVDMTAALDVNACRQPRYLSPYQT
jgi:hypothetical protein